MKSELQLLQHVLDDVQRRCGTSTSRDLKRITRRVEAEGFPFLAINLPEYGKAFERCLQWGLVPSRHNYSRSKSLNDPFEGYGKSGALPKLLSGLLGQVFDPASGVLLDEPSVDAVQAIRQICGLFAKVEVEVTPEKEAKAFDQFVECEQDLSEWESLGYRWLRDENESFRRNMQIVFNLLFGKALSRLQREMELGILVPAHGPGSTADRLLGNQKWTLPTWTRRLDECFSIADYTIPNYRYWEYLETVQILEPGEEPPVRVVSVPKTWKSPRIIAMEPTHMMYVQKAMAESLRNKLQGLDSLCREFVGINDQVPNQIMALRGSRGEGLATLDLSEASDRISNSLVKFLFSPWPLVNQGIQACRSVRADVPGRGVIPLSKFASMGSDLTFPVEIMVFLTTIFAGIASHHNTRLVREEDFYPFIGQVRVFGDDIIVPEKYVMDTLIALDAVHAIVNDGKSFWTGKFRESCGKEYFNGEDVTIVRLRREFPSRGIKDARKVMSLVSTRNQFYWKGYWSTAAYIDTILRTVFRDSYPVVGTDSPILGRESVFEPMAERIHPDLQIPLVRGYRVVSKIPDSHIEDLAALRKVLITAPKTDDLNVDPLAWIFDSNVRFEDAEHLEHSGRPHAVRIIRGWGAAE